MDALGALTGVGVSIKQPIEADVIHVHLALQAQTIPCKKELTQAANGTIQRTEQKHVNPKVKAI